MDRIIFYADFSSPYAYLGRHLIQPVATKHGRRVTWRILSLGHLWKALGRPVETPEYRMKYSRRDWRRFAELEGIRMTDPSPFPINAQLARLTYYRLLRTDEDAAVRFAAAAFDRYWGEGQDITGAEHLRAVAAAAGVAQAEVEAAATDAEAKQEVVKATTEAFERGAFGTPTFVVDDEMFWGADRVTHIDLWLASRGK